MKTFQSIIVRAAAALATVALATLTGTTVASACQVPVFRYALERWPADKYDLIVLHDGPLDDASRKLVDELRAQDHQSPVSANYSLQAVDVSSTDDQALRIAWKEHGKKGEPLLVSLYPKTAQEVPDRLISAIPLSSSSTEHLVDSPVRREVSKRLIAGESAVWIFVPCGDAKQDDEALRTLKSVIAENERSLELPEQDEADDVTGLLEEVDIELRLDFSIVTLDRNDEKEKFLLQMLLASEPDLEELNQPMAFPVLGRGRVLYALVGKGISELTIGMASRFIIGPCSCQVKNQNPGFDLLIANDWDKNIGTEKLSDPLPETDSQPVLLTIPPGKKSRNK